jgi:hypothetical protein
MRDDLMGRVIQHLYFSCAINATDVELQLVITSIASAFIFSLCNDHV